MNGQISIFGPSKTTKEVEDKSITPINQKIPSKLKILNSLSGGKTSSFIAAKYPADYNVFALVRIEDQKCKFPDEKIRREVEDRIQAPFVGTAEDDMIIYTMLDLEQYIGQKIHWVTGITFDEVVREKGGWLPNKKHRYCTTNMKIIPIFEWVWNELGEPVEVRIGYRANELDRVKKMMGKVNKNGFLMIKHSFDKWDSGRHKGKNKWEWYQWEKPVFPLVDDVVFKWEIENYWEGKPVRFATLNNCVGCFHRNQILLRKQFDWNPEKMNWFAIQEGGGNGRWRSDKSYFEIANQKLQIELVPTDFSECDSGFCEP